jgi:hypothetical protein
MTLRPHAITLLALTGLVGACGVIGYDITSRQMFLGPIDRIVFDSDSGAVEVYAYDRNAVNMYFSLRGFDTGIEDIAMDQDGADIDAHIACTGKDLCTADFYAEVPLGTRLEIAARGGGVTLTGVDADVNATVVAGDFIGFDLGATALGLAVETGNVTISWADPPTAADIRVTTGTVALTLPAGSYQCDLSATDGKVDNRGVTCDPAATSLLKVTVDRGDIKLLVGAP